MTKQQGAKDMKELRLQVLKEQKRNGVKKEERLTQKKLAALMGVSLSLVRDVEAPSSKTKASDFYRHSFKMVLVELGYDEMLPEPVFKVIPEKEKDDYASIGTLKGNDELEIQEVKRSLVELIEEADKTFIIPLSSMVETFLNQDKALSHSVSAKKFNKAIQQHVRKLYGYRH